LDFPALFANAKPALKEVAGATKENYL